MTEGAIYNSTGALPALHITDVQQFRKCRRAWKWGSAFFGHNLTPKARPLPLVQGSGIHVALQGYYNTPANERGVESVIAAFDEWYNEQIKKAGEVSPIWKEEVAIYTKMYKECVAMLYHYHLWVTEWQKDAAYEVVSMEQEFDVPLPEGGVMGAPASPYHLSGRFDGVVRDKATGKLYLLEFKTTANMRSTMWVTKYPQATAYTWAASQLFGQPLEGILYRFLVKAAPCDLRVLASGKYSQDKSQKTTYEWVLGQLRQVASAYANPAEKLSQLMLENHEILNYLSMVDENPFFMEIKVNRTPEQIQEFMYGLYSDAQLMADPNLPCYSMSGIHCGYCPFKDACGKKDMGGDYQFLLDTLFTNREFWETPTEGEEGA